MPEEAQVEELAASAESAPVVESPEETPTESLLPDLQPEDVDDDFDVIESHVDSEADTEIIGAPDEIPDSVAADAVNVVEPEAIEPAGAAGSPAPIFAASAGRLFESAGTEQRIEMIVRDALQPRLKEWLDDNLNHLVEQMVREEIQKFVGHKDD